jgi:hypothetical protein
MANSGWGREMGLENGKIGENVGRNLGIRKRGEDATGGKGEKWRERSA